MLYLNNIKPRTVKIYENDIRLHMKPALGAIRLESLKTHTIQKFYNELTHGTKGKHPLSPKTVKNIHGVLHHALNQAVAKEMLRLTRDCVDFEKGILFINKQIQLHQEKELKGAYTLTSPKNGKSRTIAAAPFVMKCLKRQKVKQTEWRLKAGEVWGNPDGLVFTDEIGGHLTKSSVYREYKAMVKRVGRPDARFHDLRHSCAVAAISSGDDIKTVQGNLGHATAAFTLDVYGYVTNKMKRESASRMEKFIQGVSGV